MSGPVWATDASSMRRRLVAPLLVAAAVVSGCAATTTSDGQEKTVQDSARFVRAAIPAIEAHAADHRGSYLDLTLAKARKWDSTIRNITIRLATRSGYCIQSTTSPFVHFAGPHGPVREGRCGARGAVVPFVRPARPPEPSRDEALAQERLRYAVPAAAGFATDNGGYAGMTIEKLRRYDAGVRDIKIPWAKRDSYCAETTVGKTTYHQIGPAEPSKPGHCPGTGG